MPPVEKSSDSTASTAKPKDASTGKKDQKVDQKEEMSAEDKALKENLELLVTVITEPKAADKSVEEDEGVKQQALVQLRSHIKTSTSSMTSIPKPLKFLRSSYPTLKKYYSSLEDKVSFKQDLADVLSVLAMTSLTTTTHESLFYKLLGKKNEDIGCWGHEYVRHLAGEIGAEFTRRQIREDDEDSTKQTKEESTPAAQTADASTTSSTSTAASSSSSSSSSSTPAVDNSPLVGTLAELENLVDQIVPFFMKHNADFDAIDLLIETEWLGKVVPYVNKDNYTRICPYVLKCSDYVADTDELKNMLDIAYQAYLQTAINVKTNQDEDMNASSSNSNNNTSSSTTSTPSTTTSATSSTNNTDVQKTLSESARHVLASSALCDALRVALKLNDSSKIDHIFTTAQEVFSEDLTVVQQLGFIAGQLKVVPESVKENEEIMNAVGNVHLSAYFQQLAQDLDVKEAKSPEDIYKSHLEEGGPARARFTRTNSAANAANANANASGVDSAKQNLASTFVNAFVNAGFGKDLLITPEGSEWLYKNRSHGMLSATASLGMLLLWDVESGFSAVDRYSLSQQSFIKAGAALANGLLSSGVTSEMDAALALLAEHLEARDQDLKLSAIYGLGLAYAGAAREDVLELLIPLIVDGDQSIEVVAHACLALGLIFVGTGNDDIAGSIVEAFMDREKDLNDPVAKFMCVGIALLYLGLAEQSEGCVSALQVITHPIAPFLLLTVEILAYAGTNSVLTIQKLLGLLSERIEEDEKEPFKTLPQEAAVLGIAFVALGEELAQDMALRALDHVLQYSEVNVRRVIPLALGLLSVSNPRLPLMDTLSKLSHDADEFVSQNAVFAMGLIGAGTNNSRLASTLRSLASYYSKEPNHLFLTRVAQGLLHMGKGLMTISPVQSDGLLINKTALAGLATLMYATLDMKNTLLSKRHYLLFSLVTAMRPRMLMTVDENLKPICIPVRVGQRVDTVGQAGKPKTITGFQSHKTPVLLGVTERAELGTEEYIPLTQVLEGVVIVKKNPDYKPPS